MPSCRANDVLLVDVGVGGVARIDRARNLLFDARAVLGARGARGCRASDFRAAVRVVGRALLLSCLKCAA